MTLSEGRLSHLAHLLLKVLVDEKLGTVRSDRLALAEAKKALTAGVLDRRRGLDQLARARIPHRVPPGQPRVGRALSSVLRRGAPEARSIGARSRRLLDTPGQVISLAPRLTGTPHSSESVPLAQRDILRSRERRDRHEDQATSGSRHREAHRREKRRPKAESSSPTRPRKSRQKGKVVAVGKGKVNDDGKVTPLDVKVGDNDPVRQVLRHRNQDSTATNT